MNKRNKNGFTLIEFVIVIAVIAILVAILIPTFSSAIRKAYQTADMQLIRNLNSAVVIELTASGKEEYDTPYDAVMACKEHGYDIAKIVAKSNYNIAYDLQHGYFVLLDEDNMIIKYSSNLTTDIKEETIDHNSKINYFVFKTNLDDLKGFSIYAGYKWSETVVNLDGVGFDAGENRDIYTINYTNSEDNNNVLVRTNSAFTSLNINDSSTSTIKHYGSLGELNINKCYRYYENGNVAYGEIHNGYLTITGYGCIELLYKNVVNATDVKAEKVDQGEAIYAYADTEDLAVNKDGNRVLNIVFDYSRYDGYFDMESEANKIITNAKIKETVEYPNHPSSAVAFLIETHEYYKSLCTIFKDANKDDSATIVLLQDCDFAKEIIVEKNITLYANNKTIINNSNNKCIYVNANGNLTVTGNGTFIGSSTAGDIIQVIGGDDASKKGSCIIENGSFVSSHVPVTCGSTEQDNYAELTIIDGYFKTTYSYYGCYAIGSYGSNAVANIIGGRIEAFGTSTLYGNFGIFACCGATLNIGNSVNHSGPVVVSELACVATRGDDDPYTINIYGGEFSTVDPAVSSGHDDRLVIMINSVSTAFSNITIYDGIFTQNSSDGHVFGFRYAGLKKVTIHGGTFSSNSYMIAYRQAEALQATTFTNNLLTTFNEGIY